MVRLSRVAVSAVLGASAIVGPVTASQDLQPVPLDTPGLRNPVVVASCIPHYTPDALGAGISGRVQLRVQLGVDGAVERAMVVRSLDKVHGLDEQAMFTVAKWKFEPATLRGVAVPVEGVVIELQFRQANGEPLQQGGCNQVWPRP
jgi:TonB family protein